MNSNILLNKIYLEVCIPKIFINNGLTLNLSSKKESTKNEPVLVKDLKINPSTSEDPEKEKDNLQYQKLGVNSQSSTNPISSMMNNRKNTFAYSTYKNPSANFFKNGGKHFNSKPSSPMNGLRNGLGITIPQIPQINQISGIPQVPQHHLRSPEFLRKNMNLGYLAGYNTGMYMNPGMSLNSASPRSFDGNPPTNNCLFPQQYSHHPLNNMHKNTHNSRRFSENTHDKLKEKPLSSLTNPVTHQNMIRSPQVYMKVNPEMMIPHLNPMNNMNAHMNSFARNMQSTFQNFNTGNNINNSNNFLNNNEFGGLNLNNHNSMLKNGFVSPRGYTNPLYRKMQSPGQENLEKNESEGFSSFNLNSHLENKNDCGVTQEGMSHQMHHLNHIKKNKKLQVQKLNLQTLTNQYEGHCNFLIFMKSCTPHVLNKNLNVLVSNYFINFHYFFRRILRYLNTLKVLIKFQLLG